MLQKYSKMKRNGINIIDEELVYLHDIYSQVIIRFVEQPNMYLRAKYMRMVPRIIEYRY